MAALATISIAILLGALLVLAGILSSLIALRFGAPLAKCALGIGWLQAMLVGAGVASTDAAAVFFLINARGLRLRPRVRAVLEVESGTNAPFAVFLALLIVVLLLAL